MGIKSFLEDLIYSTQYGSDWREKSVELERARQRKEQADNLALEVEAEKIAASKAVREDMRRKRALDAAEDWAKGARVEMARDIQPAPPESMPGASFSGDVGANVNDAAAWAQYLAGLSEWAGKPATQKIVLPPKISAPTDAGWTAEGWASYLDSIGETSARERHEKSATASARAALLEAQTQKIGVLTRQAIEGDPIEREIAQAKLDQIRQEISESRAQVGYWGTDRATKRADRMERNYSRARALAAREVSLAPGVAMTPAQKAAVDKRATQIFRELEAVGGEDVSGAGGAGISAELAALIAKMTGPRSPER